MDQLTPDSTETRNLLGQIETGDRQVFDRLFVRHRSELRKFIALRLDPRIRSRVDPSDVVQETHMEAYRRLQDYLVRRPMSFHVWLRKTAYERLVMTQRQHLQAGKRATEREVPLPDRSSHLLAQRLLSGASTPSQQLQRRELVQRVRKALAQLAPTDREILLMRNFEELSYQEVGFILGIEPAAARHDLAQLDRWLDLVFQAGSLEEFHRLLPQ
jgi:RNA polymerase sigma-70 factor (ECF subfamily)